MIRSWKEPTREEHVSAPQIGNTIVTRSVQPTLRRQLHLLHVCSSRVGAQRRIVLYRILILGTQIGDNFEHLYCGTVTASRARVQLRMGLK